MNYRVRNWKDFQHYRDRNPPWIKLHFSLLASEDWVTLDDASRVLAVACMLIASRNEGVVPGNPDYIKRVAYLNKTPNFKPLIECGFLEPDSAMLADASNIQADARPETETEKKDISLEKFAKFWTAYPRRIAKPAAFKAFRSINPDEPLLQKMLSALERQRPNWSEEKYIPYPQKWLNQRRWEDEAAPAAVPGELRVAL